MSGARCQVVAAGLALAVWTAAGQTNVLPPDLAARIDGVAFVKMSDGTPYVDAARVLRQVLGTNAPPDSAPAPALLSAALERLARRVPEGGAIHLGDLRGRIDLSGIRDGIAISGGGRDATVLLGNGQRGLSVQRVPGVQLLATAPARGPIRNLTALYTHVSHIGCDVTDSAFVAAVNGWAAYGFAADARIDNSLFLWFSRNWTFADYNAHLGRPDPDWWRKNCQAKFDFRGGGRNTRVYLMIETDYGNPGTGVWIANADGAAFYHGTTERGSSQGPGCYYLQNCRNVQLGLRRVFPGTRGGARGAVPRHALTIEGGEGNVLHFFQDFANSVEASCVNTDPALQIWGASFDFETRGIADRGVLRFAYTPDTNVPEGANAARLQGRLARGRDNWWPINARHEETFRWGEADLTRPPPRLPDGRKLPPPPSIPATDAPHTFRPLYHTLAPGYGQALLDAAADPTGARFSDDAFAQVMYGLPADDVQRLVAAALHGDTNAYERLAPAVGPGKAGRGPRRVDRGALELPAGTFRLSRTLWIGGPVAGLIGAGPERTVLRFEGDGPAIKQTRPGPLGNFAVEGGRVGIAVTGADHGKQAPPFAQSYIAGQDYFNLTFRNQRFAGLHIGCDDPGRRGGAEFDQNKFVNLKFLNTGDYGIFVNAGMLDKWLLLDAEFAGQHKAGVSVKFNSLIHGGLYNCTFRDIDGPGIDFMGGNFDYAYRPYVVMVDQCEFLECGSAAEPAVDYGYGELMSFTRTRIVTKSREIAAGFIGSVQHMEDVTVDVKTPPGRPTLVLRAVRHNATARTNGQILREVTASGPVAWTNDANAQNERFRASWVADGKPLRPDGTLDLRWDVNPAAGELAPPNGWAFPFLFYRCAFGGRCYDYALLNVDVDANRVKAEVDLAPLAR